MTKQAYHSTNIVIKSTKKNLAPIDIDGKKITIDDKLNHAYVKDTGLANEIAARYSDGSKGEISKDVVVSPVNLVTESHHNYFFGSMPEMPWKRKKENEDGKTESTNPA